jgi:hypothetical protein
MADIIWTDVVAHAPELSSVPSTAQTDVLAYANVALNASEFGGTASAAYRLARIYLAAHFGTQVSSGGAGAVLSESAGGLSVSYGGPPSSDMLATTGYGALYLALVRRSAGGPRVI